MKHEHTIRLDKGDLECLQRGGSISIELPEGVVFIETAREPGAPRFRGPAKVQD